MFHHSHWYASNDGGHNFVRGTAPGTPGGGFDYVRQPGSRTQPAGTCFAMMDAPADYDGSDGASGRAAEQGEEALRYTPTNDEDSGEEGLKEAGGPNVKWMMTSHDFGSNYTWAKMPADLQSGGFFADPTSPTSLYTMTSNCLSHSANNGAEWSPCSKASGLAGRFSQLVIKDSSTMFMLRNGAVPLRTKDGGKSWTELSQTAPLFQHGATLSASLSWSGKTLVLHGVDLSAIGRGAYGTSVWKSSDDGDTWTVRYPALPDNKTPGPA